MDQPTPIPAPPWASRSVVEDGTVVHERLCQARPPIADLCLNGLVVRERPAEVSVSVVDVVVGASWVRGEPTIQIEGGSYSLSAAAQLEQALREARNTASRSVTADVEQEDAGRAMQPPVRWGRADRHGPSSAIRRWSTASTNDAGGEQ